MLKNNYIPCTSAFSLLIIGALIAFTSGCKNSQKLQNDPRPETPEEVTVTETQVDSAEIKREAVLTELYKEELREVYKTQANSITSYYILAQQHFYNGDFEEALQIINLADNVRENADVLALKGSIFLGLGSTEKFTEYWERALEIDNNIPVPSAPFVVEALKKQGLIDENRERNF